MLYMNVWYVAEFSENLAEEPVLLKMLGRDFVLFRDREGTAVCLSNVCPHRGASLAHGTCEDGGVTCSFHGWRFDGDGVCRRIPSQKKPEREIPSTAKVDSYPTEERQGLIWVFLGDQPDAGVPLFDVEEFTDPVWRHGKFADVWASNVHWAKMTNLDHVHLPIVHGIDFGGDNPIRPPEHEVRMLPNGFSTEIRGHKPPVSDTGLQKYRSERSPVVSKLAYFTPGMTLRGQVEIGGAGSGMFNLFYEFSTPIDEETTQMRWLFFRNFAMEPENDEMHIKRNLRNVFQDKDLAESMLPKRAPDQRDWPPIKIDREDRLMKAYWELLDDMRARGWQIDRLRLEDCDRDGDYRVIPSPGRRADPDNWIFDAVPAIGATDQPRLGVA